jgi:hypothetical protein
MPRNHNSAARTEFKQRQRMSPRTDSYPESSKSKKYRSQERYHRGGTYSNTPKPPTPSRQHPLSSSWDNDPLLTTAYHTNTRGSYAYDHNYDNMHDVDLRHEVQEVLLDNLSNKNKMTQRLGSSGSREGEAELIDKDEGVLDPPMCALHPPVNNIVIDHPVATKLWINDLGELFPKISYMYNSSLQYYTSCLVEI